MIRRRNSERRLHQPENQAQHSERMPASEQAKFPYAKVGTTMVMAGAACFLLSCATAYFIMQDN